jgi:hypothetical protein
VRARERDPAFPVVFRAAEALLVPPFPVPPALEVVFEVAALGEVVESDV